MPTRHQRRPTWCAVRTVAVGIGETNPGVTQAIGIGGLVNPVTLTAEINTTKIVDQDQQHVRLRIIRGSFNGNSRRQKEHQGKLNHALMLPSFIDAALMNAAIVA